MRNTLKRIENLFDLFGRLLTGRIWIPVLIHSPDDVKGLLIKGDEWAVPRTDPFWRDEWRWIVLKPLHRASFRIYFDSNRNFFTKRFTSRIRTPYVAMRVGPHDVLVKAISDIGHGSDLMEMDVFIGPATRKEIEGILSVNMIFHQVTWI